MGRTSTKAFEHVNTFDDFKAEITSSMNYLLNGYFNRDGLDAAFQSVANMSEKTQKQVLRFMRHVDRKFATPGAAKGNRFHKIPTIMAGCIYLGNFPEQVKDLTLDELTLLSKFSIVEQPTFYETAVDYLGQDLLNAAATKHFDYMYQSTFLNLAESKIRNGEPKEKVAAHISETPLNDLIEEAFEWERELAEEAGKYL